MFYYKYSFCVCFMLLIVYVEFIMKTQDLKLDKFSTYNIVVDKCIQHIVSIPKKNEVIAHTYDMSDTHESVTRRKDESYLPKGDRFGKGGYLTFGEARNYGDPSF